MEQFNPFVGLWEAVQLEGRTTEGWKVFKIYKPGSSTWDFRPKGTVIEKIRPRPVFESVYCCFVKDKLLFIDRTFYKFDRYATRIGISNQYRFQFIAPDECWLYDLTEVIKKPEDYRFRIKIKRKAG